MISIVLKKTLMNEIINYKKGREEEIVQIRYCTLNDAVIPQENSSTLNYYRKKYSK